MASISAVIPAGCPKPDMIERYQKKLGGKSLISHAIDLYDARDDVTEIILVLSSELRTWIESDPLTFSSAKLKLCERGGSPAASAANGVRAAQGEVVIIHAGNRPNVHADTIDPLLAAVKPRIGAALGVPLNGEGAYLSEISEEETGNGKAAVDALFGSGAATERRIGHVMEHLKTEQLYVLQSPQAYNRESYLKALDTVGDKITSYSSVAEVYIDGGFELAVLPGHIGNLAATDEATFRLLLKLMGGAPKRKKDKYGGLGW